jgi:dTDP-4-dehydrorhamnose reductase
MRVTIIGSTGQLGTDLMKVLRAKHEVTGLTHRDIEVTDYNSCQILKKSRPNIVVNTAAFHKTEQCEEEPLKAFAVNSVGAKNVATASAEIQATTVYISTDYVFDGQKNEPYTEDDTAKPINTYGISKLAGEFCTKQNHKHYVIRVASLFGVAGASGKGGNLVETMINKAKQGETIRVVDDIWMSPTYTKDAATTIGEVIEKNLPYGTYHATNNGYCTWFQFTKEIFRLTELHPELVPTETTPTGKTHRPRFSALKNTKLSKHGIQTREWNLALVDYLAEKGHLDKTNLNK